MPQRRDRATIIPIRQEVDQPSDAWSAATHMRTSVPLVYLQALEGDAKSAVLLAQIIYWSSKSQDSDGWFYKDASGWKHEIGYSDYEVARCCKVLTAFGVKVKVKAVNGTPKRHFNVDQAILRAAIFNFLQFGTRASVDQSSKPEDLQIEETAKCKTKKLPNAKPRNCEVILTEITSEITSETNELSLVDAAEADATAISSPVPRHTKVAQAEANLTEESPDFKRANYVRTKIATYMPNPQTLPRASPTDPKMLKWCRDIRLMQQEDQRTPEQIKAVMDYVLATPKWYKYVLSVEGLRRWYDAIFLEQHERGAFHAKTSTPARSTARHGGVPPGAASPSRAARRAQNEQGD